MKQKVNPFDIPRGHSDWKRRKMGGHATAKGSKIKRSIRNRVTADDL